MGHLPPLTLGRCQMAVLSAEMAVRTPINPAENNPTDTIVCTASAVDTDGATIETSSTITVENTEPNVDSLSISPSTAVEANVTLEMVYSTSDIDVEALTVEFAWTDDTGTLLGSKFDFDLRQFSPCWIDHHSNDYGHRWLWRD